MGTPNPSARGDSGLGRRLSRIEDDVAQLRRLITRQPKIPAPVAAATGTVKWATAQSDVVTTYSGFPTFGSWTFYDDAIGLGGTSAAEIFAAPAGIYLARVSVDINVSGTSDVWLSANLFSDSAYVTQEFPLNLGGMEQHAASYTLGPLPVLNVEGGQLSVSFLSRSGGALSVSGSCTYNLAKIG